MKYFLIALILMLSSCTPAQHKYAFDSAAAFSSSVLLDEQYKEISWMVLNSHSFSEKEIAELKDIDATVKLLNRKYKSLTRFTDGVSLKDIALMHELAIDAYERARDIIVVHWDEQDPQLQILLQAFEASAINTSKQVTDLLSNPENKSINETLQLISGILVVTAKIIATVL